MMPLIRKSKVKCVIMMRIVHVRFCSGFKQTIEDCESVRQLHHHILGSLQQEDSELSRNLHSMYMSDTLSVSGLCIFFTLIIIIADRQ